jgi:hypothetical protein
MRTAAQTGRHALTAGPGPTTRDPIRRPAPGPARGARTRRAVAAASVALALALALPAAAAVGELAGRWRINDALTRAAQPESKGSTSTSSGLPTPVIAVGGMPVPMPGSTEAQPGLGGASPDPMVMRCPEVTVTPAGDTLQLEFHGLGSDRLRRGNDQGVSSRWNQRKLTTSYRTTTRKVSQTWEVGRDDRLVVTVKLNPDHGKTQTHKRVFDRVEP